MSGWGGGRTAIGSACAVGILLAVGAAPLAAQAADCNAPASDAVVQLKLDGDPFEALPSADGCWIFVTLAHPGRRGDGSVAVIRRDGGTLRVVRTVDVKGNPTGAVLTHDGKTMIVAANAYVDFLDVARLTSGSGDPVLGSAGGGEQVGFIYTNTSSDDKLAFISAESGQAVAVVKMDSTRARGFNELRGTGVIRTGPAPIAVTLSPDDRYLYITSEIAPKALGWPITCAPENRPESAPNHADGIVLVVELARLAEPNVDPVVARIPAGCSPVRLVLSPDGAVAYVTARGDNAVLAFDTGKMISDSAHALIGRVPVGTAPVGLAVVDSGRKLVVTNSNRFAGTGADHQQLTVVDTRRFAEGKGAVIGSIPAGGFPREMRVSADGRTLFVTNFTSQTLEMVDLARAIGTRSN